MISKETFIDTMNRLESIDVLMQDVDDALKGLSKDFGGFYIDGIFDMCLDLLVEIFHDEDHLFDYFVFELNWLHNFELGCIKVNEEDIDLSDWGKVYDFLIACMGE